MKSRLLLLTAGFGEGHNAAARALAAAADERFGPGSGSVVDLFALSRPRVNAVIRRAYLSLINRAPRLWGAAYAWLDRSPSATRLTGCLERETRMLQRLVADLRPEAIGCTYPLYAFMLERLRERGVPLPPVVNVVTDSISINALWWRADCAGWFVPNEDSAAVIRQAGVDPGRVRTLGFPVATTFATARPGAALPVLAEGAIPRVLYIVNSGTRGAIETAHRLLDQTEWDVTCTVGRNEALRTDLMRRADNRPRSTPILGWTGEIPRLLMTHHVVVSKAGGATTQEAIAARCPMIVNQIVPGQEEGNNELLRRHGIGAFGGTPEAVIAALRRAFADGGRVWSEWHSAVTRLARPNASHDIISALFPKAGARVNRAWRVPAGNA